MMRSTLKGPWSGGRKVLAFLCTLLFTLGVSRSVWASHFRYGHIDWRVANSSTRTVEFTITSAWVSETVGSEVLDFGDGTTDASSDKTIGTSTDAVGNAITVRRRVITHTYGSNGPFTAFISKCCRFSGLSNGAFDPYRIETTVDLRNANRSGPLSVTNSYRQMQAGGTRSITFPMADLDGDAVTCRFSTGAESLIASGSIDSTGGFVRPKVPNGGAVPSLSSSADTCTLTWDLTNATAGQFYAVSLMFESSHAGNPTRSAMDFIIEVSASPPPTVAVAGSPSGIFWLAAGTPLVTAITGTHATPLTALTVSTIGPAPGMTVLPAGTSASPSARNLSFTPPPGDGGKFYTPIVNFADPNKFSGSAGLLLIVKPCDGDTGDGTPSACPAIVPVCNFSTGGCIQCTPTKYQACVGTSPVCNPATSTCTACDGDNTTGSGLECPTSANPYCGPSGACGKCTDNGTGATGCANSGALHAGPICNGPTGACATTCRFDADCSGVNGGWCNAGVCAARVAPDQPIPGTASNPVSGRDPGDPVLNGTCTPTTATAVCVGGVCNTADNRCGQPNSSPCTTSAQCRSNVCNADGKCGDPNGATCTNPMAPGGVIAECRSGICFSGSGINPQDQICGLPNGEKCLSAGVCRSSVCVAVDNTCGLLNGSPCTTPDICRSNVCFADGECGLPNGQTCSGASKCRSDICRGGTCQSTCAADGDCPTSQFCNAATGACINDYPNGGPATGTCDRGAQCASNVCGSNGKCGGPTGTGCTDPASCQTGACAQGTCSTGCGSNNAAGDAQCTQPMFCNGATCSPDLPAGSPCTRAGQCTSNLCGPDGQCGLPDGQPCTTSDQCRGPSACLNTGVCAPTGCTADAQCAATSFCQNPGPNGTCVPKKANSDPCAGAAQCVSNICAPDGNCGTPNDKPCGSDLACRSGVCNPNNDLCGPCATDADCGNISSAKVCEPSKHVCVDGCRGSGGNGCAPGFVCSSLNDAIGQCAPASTDGGVGPNGTNAVGANSGSGSLSGGGLNCDCSLAPSEGASTAPLAFLAALALASGRRRKKSS